MLRYLETAREDGARAVTGGGRADGSLSDGYFVRPTILVDVDPSHAVVREEIFGPVSSGSTWPRPDWSTTPRSAARRPAGHGHRELGKAAHEFFTESKTIYLGGL